MSNHSIPTKGQRKAIRKSVKNPRKEEVCVATWATIFGSYQVRPEQKNHLKFSIADGIVSRLPRGNRNNERGIEFIPCDLCGEIHAMVSLNYRNFGYACRTCMKEYTRPCDQCKADMVYDHPNQRSVCVITKDNKHQIICRTCQSNNYYHCDKCGKHFHNSLARTPESDTLCPDCFAEFTKTHKECSSCGTWTNKALLIDGRCSRCFRDYVTSQISRPKKEIIRYGETPAFVFLKGLETGTRVFGLEWEGENGTRSESQPKRLLEELYPWKEATLKEDASVRYGFEIAFQPCDLTYIRTLLKIPELMKILKNHGFKSNDLDHEAGLHVHVNKMSFGDSERKKSKALAYFTYLWQRQEFRNQLKKFSRRRDYSYCEFYREDFTDGTIAAGYNRCVSNNKNDRNRCVNFWRHKYVNGEYQSFVNNHTVEVRLPRGTMNVTTLYATVELVDLFADIACDTKTDAEMRALTWKDICNKVPVTSPSLVTYLKKRNIWEE